MKNEIEDLGVKSIRLENLKSLIEAVGSQKKVADLLEIRSSEISQIKNPKHARNVGDSLARRIEKTFGFKNGSMDTLLIIENEAHLAKPLDGMTAEEVRRVRNEFVHGGTLKNKSILAFTGVVNKALEIEKSNAEYAGHIDAWDSNTPLDEDEVELPYFMNVELAAGIGADAVAETNGPKLRFSKSTLRRCGVDADSAACVKVSGNSMEPRLFDGDVVGVNTADTSIVDGKTYAINHEGMLRVKRLYRVPGGGVRVNSMNSLEHPDETYSSLEIAGIKVIGRVFWHSSIW